MRERKNPPSRILLTFIFAAIVFFVLVVTMFIVGTAVYILTETGLLDRIESPNFLLPTAVFALVSIILGTAVAAIMGRVPLKPVNKLISGMNSLAGGNFDTRIEMKGNPVGREISESFNILAEELKNTEMLRADFINNFSHEFKTPIVSIRGFAKLLKKGNLSEAQQQEYLDIILTESSRLADMATNVLNLTKVENQSILSDITHFNLSEQIRDCILLLEKKWTRKNLTILADFDEHFIDASEELLMQVWINLLDNAIKFSDEGGEVGVTIAQAADTIVVQVQNSGPMIGEDEMKRVFNRFWQGDTSHAAEGTGIGLSIASRIVQLHKGDISASSTTSETVFSVLLPIS